MLKTPGIFVIGVLIASCSQQRPVIDEEMMSFEGVMPADLSGSWERDYSRGDEVNAVLADVLYRLSRTSPDARYSGQSRYGGSTAAVPQRHRASVYALARLAEEITRPQVLTISQNEHEISIERKDDYAIFCAFYGGLAKATESSYGAELCGWDGDQLVSNLILPGGLQVTHRFTVSQDGKKMRVVTSVSSSTAPLPFTLSRFYMKFAAPKSDFNCIETLSMKRVCSTGDIVL